jgi:hypothetical protein
MKLEILAKVLEDAGIGTIGETIFVHRMDAETNVGILLRNPLDGTPVDPNLPGYYRSKLQAIVRHTTQQAGDELTGRVGKALKMFNRRFTGPGGELVMKINHIFPSQLPITYPRLPGQGIEWSLNFTTSYVQP